MDKIGIFRNGSVTIHSASVTPSNASLCIVQATACTHSGSAFSNVGVATHSSKMILGRTCCYLCLELPLQMIVPATFARHMVMTSRQMDRQKGQPMPCYPY